MSSRLACQVVLIICSIVLGVSACNAERQADGVKLADSPELWEEFVTVTNWHLSDERQGIAPPGGLASWNDHWSRVLKLVRSNQENPDRYIHFIINRRRELGLPPIQDSEIKPFGRGKFDPTVNSEVLIA